MLHERTIDIHIPVTHCNLSCHYCYVSHKNMRNAEATPFKCTAEELGNALTIKRLGRICHFNICGLGETLIPQQTVDITKELLKQGYYIIVVTNGLLKERLKQFCSFPDDYKKRLGFKFSFHFLELKTKNLMEEFFSNIDMVRKAGMSFSLEMTPSDELEPYIQEIKKICMENVGALCNVTIPRDMTKKDPVLLSKHLFEEFGQIWKVFVLRIFSLKSALWEEMSFLMQVNG